MPEAESGESDKTDGLSESILIKHGLSTLRALINDLVDAMQGDEGIKYKHLVRSMKDLHAQHERILSKMAQMDGEIIRAHERLDSARRYLRKLQTQPMDNDDQKGAVK